MPSTATFQRDHQQLLTKSQTADHYHVTTRTIDHWVKRGMPYHPCGGAKRFTIEEVDAWLRRDEQARLRSRHDDLAA